MKFVIYPSLFLPYCSTIYSFAFPLCYLLRKTPCICSRAPHFKYDSLLQNRPLFQVIYPGYLWARDKRWLLSRVQRLAGPAGGQGPFVPGGATNPDKRPPFCPGWWLHPGQKVQPLLSRLVLPTRTKGPST